MHKKYNIQTIHNYILPSYLLCKNQKNILHKPYTYETGLVWIIWRTKAWWWSCEVAYTVQTVEETDTEPHKSIFTILRSSNSLSLSLSVSPPPPVLIHSHPLPLQLWRLASRSALTDGFPCSPPLSSFLFKYSLELC